LKVSRMYLQQTENVHEFPAARILFKKIFIMNG